MLKFGMITLGAGLLTAAQPVPSASMEAMNSLMSGRYLAGIEGLRKAVDGGDKSASSILSQFEPAITGFPRAVVPVGPKLANPQDIAALERAALREAVSEIVARARDTRIVILNEAHDTPRHRAFALEVARALRSLGFTHLAAETFTNNQALVEELGRNRYPLLRSGTYTIEPVFADFVRQSLQLGYKPVAYEEDGPAVDGSLDERVAAREEAQAKSLAGHLTSAGRDSKFIIFVGYGHVAEEPLPGRNSDGSSARWMAARLKEKTGINPLTIDQTVLNQFSGEASSLALYHAIALRLKSGSSVLMEDEGPLVLGRMRGAVDLQVVHAPMRMKHGRPTWLSSMGRRPVKIPSALLPRTGRRLVQAFIAEEQQQAIPVDQVLVTAGEAVPALMLPARPIRFTWEDTTAPAFSGR